MLYYCGHEQLELTERGNTFHFILLNCYTINIQSKCSQVWQLTCQKHCHIIHLTKIVLSSAAYPEVIVFYPLGRIFSKLVLPSCTMDVAGISPLVWSGRPWFSFWPLIEMKLWDPSKHGWWRYQKTQDTNPCFLRACDSIRTATMTGT